MIIFQDKTTLCDNFRSSFSPDDEGRVQNVERRACGTISTRYSQSRHFRRVRAPPCFRIKSALIYICHRGCTHYHRGCSHYHRGCTHYHRAVLIIVNITGGAHYHRGCTHYHRGCTQYHRGCTPCHRECTVLIITGGVLIITGCVLIITGGVLPCAPYGRRQLTTTHATNIIHV